MTAWSDGPDDLVAELKRWGGQGGPVSGRLVGRIVLPAAACPRGIEGGPTPVLVRDGVVLDLSTVAPTVADLLDLRGPGSSSSTGPTFPWWHRWPTSWP